MTPERIQRQRTKGWRTPEHTRYVGRPGKFGNPFQGFKLGGFLACKLFDMYLHGDDIPRFVANQIDDEVKAGIILEVLAEAPNGPTLALLGRDDLKGWNLSCWCKPEEPCHGDTWLEVANV